MDTLKRLWYSKPAAVIAAVQAIITFGAAFGLDLTKVQTTAIVGLFLTAQALFGDAKAVVSRPLMKALSDDQGGE